MKPNHPPENPFHVTEVRRIDYVLFWFTVAAALAVLAVLAVYGVNW